MRGYVFFTAQANVVGLRTGSTRRLIRLRIPHEVANQLQGVRHSRPALPPGHKNRCTKVISWQVITPRTPPEPRLLQFVGTPDGAATRKISQCNKRKPSPHENTLRGRTC